LHSISAFFFIITLMMLIIYIFANKLKEFLSIEMEGFFPWQDNKKNPL
jgi:hypothetical protein